MYYINPWFFYIVGLITNIQIFCAVVLGFGGVVWFIGLLAGPTIIDEMTDTKEKEETYLKVFWKWMKKMPLIFLLCGGFIIITPSESTIYKMLIASKVSTEDVDHVFEKIDDVVDLIIESKEQASGSEG